jgi:hypothetical protein
MIGGIMSLIKHHKKFIALFVVLSFLYLVEISYLPLRAEPAPAKAPVSMNGDDQTPGSIEQEGGGYVHKKKSSPILPIIIGVVVLGAVAAVLILVVFKTKYDITGTWSKTLVRTSPSPATATAPITFTGTKTSGSFSYAGLTGTYTVDGKNVTYSFVSSGQTVQFTGTFTAKETMSGEWHNVQYPNYYGTWTATKTASAAMPGNHVDQSPSSLTVK